MLSIFLQLGCTQSKTHEFLCRPLPRIDVVDFLTTSIRCRCMELVRNLYATCRQTCQVLYQSTNEIHSRQISTETQNSYLLCNTQHKTSPDPPACLIRPGVVVVVPGCQGQASTLPCCRCRHPTGGGGPKSKGGSTAGRQRGNRGIAAVVTAALAQWARIPMRLARVGATLAASDWEGGHQRRMPVHDIAMGDREGGECATATGGGVAGGEEDEAKRQGRRCWWGCIGGGRQW
jgi:hypothetical protein